MLRLLNQGKLRLERDIMDNRYLHHLLLICKRWLHFPSSLKQSLELPRFQVGDIYLDCSYHPVIATEVEKYHWQQPGAWDYDLAGVSMIDGSWPRSCSVLHCAPQKLDLVTALLITAHWDEFVNAYSRLSDQYQTSEELRRIMPT